MAAPIVFVNIGWMKRYEGHSALDPLRAKNFSYFTKHNIPESKGHEQWNFRPEGGVVLGYVPRSANININRLGATRVESEVKGVLVIFIARDPVANELKVVGWYRNATVARDARFRRRYGAITVVAPIKSSEWFVLPVANRDHTVVVPTAHKEAGGVGQSPIWYGDSHPKLVSKIRALAERGAPPTQRVKRRENGRSRRGCDVDGRLEVERRSMNCAMDYFDEAVDVSKLCKGWDIEAKGRYGDVYIEVKGVSGDRPIFELTPREYAMMKEHQSKYLIFVVTAALSSHPVMRTFAHDSTRGSEGTWISDRGEVLLLEARLGARGRVRSLPRQGHTSKRDIAERSMASR